MLVEVVEVQSDGDLCCLSVRYLYHNTEALLWENRKHLLLRELREARADVSHVFSLSSSTASLDPVFSRWCACRRWRRNTTTTASSLT